MSGDEYDALGHRVLVADCASNTLIGIDAATGERSVVIDSWPWFEPNGTVCVDDLVVEHDGQYVYAFVDRTFVDPDGSGITCSASEFVKIDAVLGEVSPIYTSDYSCCDDCGSDDETYSPQVDLAHKRLLTLDAQCNPNACVYALASTAFDGEVKEQVHRLYVPACYPDDEDCPDPSYVSPDALTFDPVAPDSRVLVLASPSSTWETYIDSIDLDTGEIIETIPIQTQWGDLDLSYVRDISIDDTNGRALLTLAGRRPGGPTVFGVVAIDRFTGEQTLLHDGGATADGRTLACTPNAAVDTLTGRLLLVEPPGGYLCEGNTFALDLKTGELSAL